MLKIYIVYLITIYYIELTQCRPICSASCQLVKFALKVQAAYQDRTSLSTTGFYKLDIFLFASQYKLISHKSSY